ncbi:hypothetical protein F5Y19DRAFT_446399 [Xylariaceae sp. FL1651]|nr:hypothetical protein F5Y19DRAFT_446399 [Xylariaceae sp. FL1651]
MTSLPSSLPSVLPRLTTREAITDIVYRSIDSFLDSFNIGGEPLLRSAVTAGIDAIVTGIFAKVAKMIIIHYKTNVRILRKDSDTKASITANRFA